MVNGKSFPKRYMYSLRTFNQICFFCVFSEVKVATTDSTPQKAADPSDPSLMRTFSSFSLIEEDHFEGVRKSRPRKRRFSRERLTHTLSDLKMWMKRHSRHKSAKSGMFSKFECTAFSEKSKIKFSGFRKNMKF